MIFINLPRWKLFLPEKWREACALNADGMLDPNLTLAHITHNTAVALLHQGIAYPSPEWQANPIRLPSVSSAETCIAAAIEVAIIADKYLQGTTSLTNPQFAFCLFVCGRMLLAHALHYNTAMAPELGSLISSLDEISRRWNGPHLQDAPSTGTQNLASKFSTRLVQARDHGPYTLDIREAVYSEEKHRDDIETEATLRNPSSEVNSIPQPQLTRTVINEVSPHESLAHTGTSNIQLVNNDHSMMIDQGGSPDSISLAFPPLPLAFQPHCVSAGQTTMPSPLPSHMQQSSSFYGRSGETDFNNISNISNARNTAFDGSGSRSEDLNSFFEYSFLPIQRISMFSNADEKTRGADQ
jgi:hypothetical protein